MPRYELYRIGDHDELIEHSVFVSMTDHAAVHVAQAVAMVGGKVEIWRDGTRIGVLNTPCGQVVPASAIIISFPKKPSASAVPYAYFSA